MSSITSQHQHQHQHQGQDIWFSWNGLQVTGPAPGPAYSGIFFDETLRDGLQAPYVRIPPPEQKLALAGHMAASGVQAADLGFPGSGPAALRECTQIARQIAASGYRLAQGYAGRAHPGDIRAICEVAQGAGVPVDAYIFIGISPIRQYAEHWDTGQIQRKIVRAAAQCHRGGARFVLVLEDAMRCTPQVLRRVLDAAVEAGAARVTLCDTAGAALPAGTEALIRWTARYLRSRRHPAALEWHGHNDRGLALACSLTAWALGCARVHGTILGIGERAGNASLDQLIINARLDGHAEYDLAALRRYCEYAAPVLEVPIPDNYPAMGAAVFRTSAGVHASAILKAHQRGDARLKDAVYSSVPARLLGREQEILIDASSGASNVRYWLLANGHGTGTGPGTDEAIARVLARAKAARQPLTHDQIHRIITGQDPASATVTTLPRKAA